MDERMIFTATADAVTAAVDDHEMTPKAARTVLSRVIRTVDGPVGWEDLFLDRYASYAYVLAAFEDNGVKASEPRPLLSGGGMHAYVSGCIADALKDVQQHAATGALGGEYSPDAHLTGRGLALVLEHVIKRLEDR